METLRQRGLEVEAQLEPEHREWFSRALRALNGTGVRVMHLAEILASTRSEPALL